MKTNFIALLFFTTSFSYSQPDTEVFLFDLDTSTGTIEVTNGQNISNNAGYDNQPYFFSDDLIVFASNNGGQTDVAAFTVSSGKLSYISKTAKGGEYSPQKIPKKYALSAVRLDDDGKQRLYSYNMANGSYNELIKDLVVAYYVWSDEKTVVSAVISENALDLYQSDVSTGTNQKIVTNVGRSFHVIPNSDRISYISKTNAKEWQIRSYNPKTKRSALVAYTPLGVEDMCWLNDKTLLSSRDNVLYKLTLKKDRNWQPIANLSSYNISSISRLAVNKSGTKLVLAGESLLPPKTKTENVAQNSSFDITEAIVQQQLDAYNARNIDAFMATYSEDVKIYNYPNTLMSEGQAAMRPGYASFFKNTPDLHCDILERIVIGNKVIDHEHVTVNGNTFKAVAIYEVVDGLIAKVTFIR